MLPLPTAELADAVRLAGAGWEELRGHRFLITGGSGCAGRWLVETFLTANRSMGLGAEMTLLTRNRRALLERTPQLEGAVGVKLLEGDVLKFPFPAGEFTDVIHAIPGAGAGASPMRQIDTIVLGTRRLLDFSEARGVRRMLFLSSGAPASRNPDAPSGEAYRLAELMCLACSRESGMEVKIARCFPLDRPDAAATAAWLWSILMRGEAGRAYIAGEDGLPGKA